MPVDRVDFSSVDNIFPTLHRLCLCCHFPVAGQSPSSILTMTDMKRTDQTCSLEVESTLTMSLLAFLITTYCVPAPARLCDLFL